MRPWPFDAAALELERVVRIELARLLLGAAALRASAAPLGACFPPGAEEGGEPPPLADWRARARRAARAAGVPGLAALARRALAAWPPASLLARRALELDPGAPARVALAAALLAEGEPAAAAEVALEVALAEDPDGRAWRARALAALAWAHEQRGSDRLALGACEAAASEPGADATPLVNALFLALATADRARARRAAERLDARADERSVALARAVERVALRVELLRGGLPWRAPRSSALFLPRLAARAGASGALARRLLVLPAAGGAR